MHTHFAPIPAGVPSYGVRFTLFSLDTCEQCDHEVTAPNAVGTFELESRLKAMGLKKRDTMPEELSYCEEVEMAVCETCLEIATADSA